MSKEDKGSGVAVNGKELVKGAIDGALGAGKANAGNLKALKIKMKFGKDGESDSKPRKKNQGMRSFINSQRAS